MKIAALNSARHDRSSAEATAAGADVMFAVALVLLILGRGVEALVVFTEFAWWQVVLVELVFVILLGTLTWIFAAPSLQLFRWRPTWMRLGGGFLLGVILNLFAMTSFTGSEPSWRSYFPISPLGDLAAGAGVHQDTLFHASLIQSILNFGYPSTGQHGVPFLPYHALSHYVDAGIVSLVGVEPLDAAGLLFFFKAVALVAACAVFVWVALRGLPRWVLWAGVLLATPLILGNWLAIGSEGLWIPTVLVVLGAPAIHRALWGDSFNWAGLTLIFSLGVIIGLGKVSSGLSFALFVGLVALIRKPRDVRVYVMGIVWAIFFGVFSVAQNSGGSSGVKPPHLTGIFGFLNPWTTYPGGPVEWNLVVSYLVIAALVLTWWITKNRRALVLACSALVVLFVLSILVQLPAPGGLMMPDIAYFVIGLSLPLLLLAFLVIIDELASHSSEGGHRAMTNPGIVSLLVILCLTILVAPKPNLLTARPLQPEQSNESSLVEFRQGVNDFIAANGMTKQNTYLVVPGKTFDRGIWQWGVEPWARGLAVYAVTGVPLLHGITDPSQKDFGQSGYDRRGRAINEFDPGKSVDCSLGKNVIVLESVSPLVLRSACQ